MCCIHQVESEAHNAHITYQNKLGAAGWDAANKVMRNTSFFVLRSQRENLTLTNAQLRTNCEELVSYLQRMGDDSTQLIAGYT